MQLRYFFLLILLFTSYFCNTNELNIEGPFCANSYIRKGTQCYFINPYKYNWKVENKFCVEKERLEKQKPKKEAELTTKAAQLGKKEAELITKEAELTKKEAAFTKKEAELAKKEAERINKPARRTKKEGELTKKETELIKKEAELIKKEGELTKKEAEFAKKETEFNKKEAELAKKEAELIKKPSRRTKIEGELTKKETELAKKEEKIEKKEKELAKNEKELAKNEEEKRQRQEQMKKEAERYPARNSCPKLFTQLNKKCYYKDNDQVHWNNAKDNCLNRGASLLMIETKKERELLSEWLKSDKSYLWTSGIRSEGLNFTYQNGKPLSYTFWNDNQPDSPNSGQDCIMLAFNDNLLFMSDFYCSKISNRFVCEIQLN